MLNFVDFFKKIETARETINIWVKNRTKQKFKEFIKPGMIDSHTTLVLCNAIYFNGDWQSRFKNKTIDADFYISLNKTIKAPMMSQTSSF